MDHLPYKISKPWLAHVDEENFFVSWAYGPQGHPASMRVHLDAFAETDWQLSLTVMSRFFITEKRFDGTAYLIQLLLHGQKINERWGTKWDWWRCKEDCPLIYDCPDCEKTKDKVNIDVASWLLENPVPKPSDK